MSLAARPDERKRQNTILFLGAVPLIDRWHNLRGSEQRDPPRLVFAFPGFTTPGTRPTSRPLLSVKMVSTAANTTRGYAARIPTHLSRVLSGRSIRSRLSIADGNWMANLIPRLPSATSSFRVRRWQKTTSEPSRIVPTKFPREPELEGRIVSTRRVGRWTITCDGTHSVFHFYTFALVCGMRCTGEWWRDSRLHAAVAANARTRRANMKILMVLTSNDRVGDTGRKTGFWLE